ncbi:PAS domain-containing sensor histidine kinase [Brucella pituitosa]|uniref:PAS domain-containing sensor histidine kinase n=1 Tax=Brucella pituitosa TaxID=571256 RepID=UPI0009A23676|nr:PAS domain-containing sensor histidine kinase [Brucella pituitosa]
MNNDFAFLNAEGQSADDIRSFDWDSSALGAPSQWPASLKTALQMMLASHFPKAIVWGPAYITFYNDAFRPILGAKENCMGKSFRDIWAEAWPEILPIVEKAYQGEATFIEDFPLVINRYGYPEQCYFTFCYSPIRLQSGDVGGMIDTVVETTGKVEAEKRALIFNSELAHRIKNTFSIVNSIANQTFVDADSQQRHKFTERLNALSQAHEILRLHNSTQSSLSHLVGNIASALGVAERMDINGPEIAIGSKGVASISLLIHELTTNAIKYGSLSNDGGRVKVAMNICKLSGTDTLTLSWKEIGGPQIAAPTRKGFGTKLIRTGLLGTGDVTLNYEPSGLQAEMTAPVFKLRVDTEKT